MACRGPGLPGRALPVDEGMTTPVAVPPIEVTAGRVLIVDDEASTRELLRDLLEMRGHQVVEATNGEDALRRAVEDRPDAILLDVMMPGLDGFEVCRRLKLDPRTVAIPVLLVTTLSARDDRLKGIEAGAGDFLSKPIDRQDALLRVRNAVRLRQLHAQVSAELDRVRELEVMRDELVHWIVHDMRSPLQGAMLGVQLLSMQLDPVLTERQRGSLDRTLGILRHVAEMTSAVLDVSRLEEGRFPLHLDSCELKGILQRAIDDLRPLVAHLRIDVEAPAGTVELRADANLVERILVNLIANAAKFTPAGGELRVAILERGPLVRVEVTDTGPGIPARHREFIFEKFGQAEARREHCKYSSGLGLAFCRLAVEAHGGSIGVESEVGRGSTFWFELPLDAGTAA
jgi:two-component system sensor histidine kinase/response regulator